MGKAVTHDLIDGNVETLVPFRQRGHVTQSKSRADISEQEMTKLALYNTI